MQIYIAQQLDQMPPELFQRLFALLPPERREKVQRLNGENRKRQSAMAYLLLAHAVRQEIGQPMLPRLPKEGKPVILGREDLHCSISHCKLAAAAVVDTKPVGVDIESVRPYNEKVARYVCSPEELARIQSSQDSALAFTVLWTKKESLIKLRGGSIGPGMRDLAADFDNYTFETKICDGWVVTACCQREG